jgi:protein required for attachment to host cells
MSASLTIPAGARVVVADARKALFLTNRGDALYPNLSVVRTLHAAPNPRTSEQGADRPGRTGFAGRKSAVGQTDWHRQGEEHFAAQVVEALAADQGTDPLFLVAAPSFLAELRRRLPASVKSSIRAEIAKDLTHLPVGEIERHLSAAEGAG